MHVLSEVKERFGNQINLCLDSVLNPGHPAQKPLSQKLGPSIPVVRLPDLLAIKQGPSIPVVQLPDLLAIKQGPFIPVVQLPDLLAIELGPFIPVVQLPDLIAIKQGPSIPVVHLPDLLAIELGPFYTFHLLDLLAIKQGPSIPVVRLLDLLAIKQGTSIPVVRLPDLLAIKQGPYIPVVRLPDLLAKELSPSIPVVHLPDLLAKELGPSIPVVHLPDLLAKELGPSILVVRLPDLLAIKQGPSIPVVQLPDLLAIKQGPSIPVVHLPDVLAKELGPSIPVVRLPDLLAIKQGPSIPVVQLPDLLAIELGPSIPVAWLKGRKFGPFIDGSWIQESGGGTEIHNPCTGHHIATVVNSSQGDVDRAVASSATAFLSWRQLSGHDRAKYLYSLARHLQKNVSLLVQVECLNRGVQTRDPREFDVPAAVRHFYHYAGWAQLIHSDLKGWEPQETKRHSSMPVGTWPEYQTHLVRFASDMEIMRFKLQLGVLRVDFYEWFLTLPLCKSNNIFAFSAQTLSNAQTYSALSLVCGLLFNTSGVNGCRHESSPRVTKGTHEWCGHKMLADSDLCFHKRCHWCTLVNNPTLQSAHSTNPSVK
uniref:Aldehyde dehydrogenase domain-containing protein n=1 Tax=Timema douglasi TaxID=61478 RepID=A0A7R8VGI7_TIMDO|nr:unnamed protein product [Timema douglasi]